MEAVTVVAVRVRVTVGVGREVRVAPKEVLAITDVWCRVGAIRVLTTALVNTEGLAFEVDAVGHGV